MFDNKEQRYKIWIGDKIEGYENFADIDYPSYLANRQMIIAEYQDSSYRFEREASDEINKRFRNQGGTVLTAHNGKVNIDDFKVAGTENMDSWNGVYLLASVDFGNKSVCRVNYKTPSERHVLCSRVLSANGAYMISYNVKDIANTFRVYPAFMESIKETRMRTQLPLVTDIPTVEGGAIRPKPQHTTEVHTINIPTIRSPSRTQRSGRSQIGGVAALGAAAGIATEVGLGLAIDHALDIGNIFG